MSGGRSDNRHRGDASAQTFGIGGEPSPLIGAVRGLAHVVGAVGVLVVTTALVAAVVALLY